MHPGWPIGAQHAMRQSLDHCCPMQTDHRSSPDQGVRVMLRNEAGFGLDGEFIVTA